MSIEISNPEIEANREMLQRVTLHFGDVAEQEVDAIFASLPFKNKSKSELDRRVRMLAGPAYDSVIDDLVSEQKPGFCVLAPSGNMPCRAIIACVTPKWDGGFMGEDRHLLNCYENALRLAMDEGYRRVAMPVFFTGNHGYPKPRTVRLALKAVFEVGRAEYFDEIRLVGYTEELYNLIYERLQRYGWEGTGTEAEAS